MDGLLAMELNQAQNSFYINPDNGFKVPPAQRKLERTDSVVDNDAMLEVCMTQCSENVYEVLFKFI